MDMPGRTISNISSYRYGFNKKEKDTDVSVQYDYGFRIYDPRLVRFKSVDPLTKLFAWNSPYSYAEGDLIRSIDLDGLEKYIVTNVYDAQNRIVSKSIVTVVTSDDTKTIVDIDFKYANGGKDATSNNVLVYNVQADGNFTRTEQSELDKSDQTFYDTYKRNRHDGAPGNSFLIGGAVSGVEKNNPFQSKRYSKEEYNYVGAGASYLYPSPDVKNVQGPMVENNQNLNVNYVPGAAQYATSADQSAVNNVASMAPNQFTPGNVVSIPNGTQQTTTSVRSRITINLQTAGPNRLFYQNLLTRRYNLLRATLINQGVPAGNISRGASQFNVPLSNMNGNENQVNFNIRTRTTTTTTTTTNQATQVIIR